jgi:hypothetical protein
MEISIDRAWTGHISSDRGPPLLNFSQIADSLEFTQELTTFFHSDLHILASRPADFSALVR